MVIFIAPNFLHMFKLIIALRPAAKYYLVVLTIAIITVSSLPSLPTPKIDTGNIEIRLDYVFHLLEYGGLSFFAFLTFTGTEFLLTRKKVFYLTISLLAFCILDEFHQKLIPGRTFNTNDILSNVTGVLVAMGFCVVVFRKIRQTNG